MLQRLEQIEARYEELANELSAPELLADQAAYTKAARQHRYRHREAVQMSFGLAIPQSCPPEVLTVAPGIEC